MSLAQRLNFGNISGLRPYNNKWLIKAYVEWKSDVKPFSNGKGKQFKVVLKDKSGNIQATIFNKECDKFYNVLEVGNSYIISNGTIKPVNKQYISQATHGCELIFNENTTVKIWRDKHEIKHDLVPIGEVLNMPTNAYVNIIGICRQVGELKIIPSNENKIRDLILVDQSYENIPVTLWGNNAVHFDRQVNSVIMLTKCKVSNYLGNVKLNHGYYSSLIADPDIPEAHNLRDWFNSCGADNLPPLSLDVSNDFITLRDAIRQSHDCGDKSGNFQCTSIIKIITNDTIVYKSCVQCEKKLSEEGDGRYRCEQCGIFSNFKYSFRLKMKIVDSTAEIWAVCFNKVGEKLLKHSASEVGEALETDSTATDKMFEDVKWLPFVFKMHWKCNYYNGELTNQLIVQSITPVDRSDYNRRLIKDIKNMTAIEVN